MAAGIAQTIFDIGKMPFSVMQSTLSPLGDKAMPIMGATYLSSRLTGEEFDEFIADPTKLYSSPQTKVNAEKALTLASQAPGALWRGTLKAGIVLGSLPTIANIAAGTTRKGAITPIGLRTFMYGSGRASLWGYAAGTIMTGSPLGGAVLGSSLNKFARGTLFKNMERGGLTGLLEHLGFKNTKFGKYARNFLSPEDLKFNATLSRIRVRKATDKFILKKDLKKTQINKDGTIRRGAKIDKSKIYTKTGQTTRETLFTIGSDTTGVGWIQEDRLSEFNKRLNKLFTTEGEKRTISRVATKSELDELLDEYGTSRSRRTIFRRMSSKQAEGTKAATIMDLGKIPDATRTVGGKTYDYFVPGKGWVTLGSRLDPIRKLGVMYGVADDVRSRMMKDLLGGRISRTLGVSGIGFMSKILNPERLDTYGRQVDTINNKLDDLEKAFNESEISKGVTRKTTPIRETRRPTAERLKGVRTKGRYRIPKGEKFLGGTIDDVVQDIATAKGSRRLSLMGMAGRASLVHAAGFIRMMYVGGLAKRGIGTIVENTLNTARTVTNIARNIGSMEFGTGKTLQTRTASTERSRAIQAMQYVGISARSYLGQEASILAQGA